MEQPGGAELREARSAVVFEQHVEDVRRYLHARSPAGVADEVVADVFLVVWRRFDELPAHALPWLLGVARRCRLAAERSERRQRAIATRIAAQPLAESSSPLAAGSDLAAALATLTESDRELLLLIAWEGLDADQVARVLGVRRGSIYMRLHRARHRLATALANEQRAAAPVPPAAANVGS